MISSFQMKTENINASVDRHLINSGKTLDGIVCKI